MQTRLGPVTRVQRLLGLKDLARLPTASQVLTAHLEKRSPVWTSFFLPYKFVINDHWGWSHFNWSAGGHNYHVLRTGCYPYIKYHCDRRPVTDLSLENNFFVAIKLLNLGLGTLAYGTAARFLITWQETVPTEKGDVTVYFLYKENYDTHF